MTLTPGRVAELRSRLAGEVRRMDAPFLEARAESHDDGSWTLFGHAAVFDRKSTPIPDGWGGSFVEVVKRGSFKDVLDEDQDVTVLYNHDPNMLLGRTGNKTFTVRESPRGLEYRGVPAPTSYAADLKVLLDRGDVNRSSFGFSVAEDRWTETRKDDGTTEVLREILKVKRLYDVSPVVTPAYPQTDAGARAETLKQRALRAAGKAMPDPDYGQDEEDESLGEDLAEAIEALSDLLGDDLDFFQQVSLAQPIADLVRDLSALLAEHASDPVPDDGDEAAERAASAQGEQRSNTAEGEAPGSELDGKDAGSAESRSAASSEAEHAEERQEASPDAGGDDLAARRFRLERLSRLAA